MEASGRKKRLSITADRFFVVLFLKRVIQMTFKSHSNQTMSPEQRKLKRIICIHRMKSYENQDLLSQQPHLC